MAKHGLTKKDELFVDEYFNNGFNATSAYRTVFKNTNKHVSFYAYQLLNKNCISVEIEKRWDEIKNANIIKREEIMINLKELMCNAIDSKDNNTLLKTIDIINKMNGAYTTHIEANVNQSIKLNIPGIDLPDESQDDENDKEE